MIKLTNIIRFLDVLEVSGTTDLPVNSVCFDSRKATVGDLFVAVKGVKSDGHEYIPAVIGQGVKAVLCENIPADCAGKATFIRVSRSQVALGMAASAFYDDPSAQMKLVGVTGTNGKTTTATLLYRLFTALGYKCGLLSTVKNYIVDTETEASHTTPDAVQINRLMHQMVKAGCTHCFMEVSSHSIDQDRIAGLQFAGAVFTNLTHDHLDYHKTFDNYLKAKKKFFDQLPSGAFALVNHDDRNGMVMVQNTKALVKTYALRSMADYSARIVENHFDGMQLRVGNKDVWTHLKGEFNAYNFLAVFGAARLLGEQEEALMLRMSELHEVRGRFETLRSASGITAIIDYAHTPDALENVLRTIHQIKSKDEGQIIGVIGAGGDRDRTKRPLMGKIAAGLCDKLIITSDNPRSEEPESIIEEIVKGIPMENSGKIIQIVNREEAIRAACLMARKGDVILVAGKGHETYQEIKGVKYHFDDRELVLKQFEHMNR